MNAPIILFTYNRPEHTLKVLESIKNNTLAPESKLIIFSDGAKNKSNEKELQLIGEVRKVIKSKQWCKNVEIIEQESNKGLDLSIIEGVSKVIDEFGKVIVLEDDIITSKYFLEFMNDSLNIYENSKHVFHVSGYQYPIKLDFVSNLLIPSSSAWGWGTWKDRWCHYDHFAKDRVYIENSKSLMSRFNHGDLDLFNIFKSSSQHWDIRWYFTIFQRNALTVFPSKSLVKNIGFDGSGTNCNKTSRYKTELFEDRIPVNQDYNINLAAYAVFLKFFENRTNFQKQTLLSFIERYVRNIMKK